MDKWLSERNFARRMLEICIGQTTSKKDDGFQLKLHPFKYECCLSCSLHVCVPKPTPTPKEKNPPVFLQGVGMVTCRLPFMTWHDLFPWMITHPS